MSRGLAVTHYYGDMFGVQTAVNRIASWRSIASRAIHDAQIERNAVHNVISYRRRHVHIDSILCPPYTANRYSLQQGMWENMSTVIEPVSPCVNSGLRWQTRRASPRS